MESGIHWELGVVLPLPEEAVYARLTFGDGSTRDLIVRGGAWRGTLPARPTHLRFVDEPTPGAISGEGGPTSGAAELGVDVREVFSRGVELPESDRVTLVLRWASPCHHAVASSAPERRFGSLEHLRCAAFVGLEAPHDDAPPSVGLEWLTDRTRLPVGGKELTMGEMIFLAGDYYAHLDDRAAREFADAWPEAPTMVGVIAGQDYRATTLAGDDAESVRALIETIRAGDGGESLGRDVSRFFSERYPVRRYLALASQNHCHFGHADDALNEALSLYRRYHARALAEAARAPSLDSDAFRAALVTDAFGCHFLTDLFATGHMRVPRRLLSERFGMLRGALRMSAAMHAEDNDLGLWVTTRGPVSAEGRVVWRAFGDGALRHEYAGLHLRRVQDAVRRSVLELAARQRGETVADSETALAWIPVVLPVGATFSRARGDVSPESAFDVNIIPADMRAPNHAPMFVVLSNGHIGRRVGEGSSREYRDLEDHEPSATSTSGQP